MSYFINFSKAFWNDIAKSVEGMIDGHFDQYKLPKITKRFMYFWWTI